MNCIVTYQKSNGEIFIRPYDFTFKRVGDETSMGWKIIDIHYKYKDNYYCLEDYQRLFRKELYKNKNKKIIKHIIKFINKYS